MGLCIVHIRDKDDEKEEIRLLFANKAAMDFFKPDEVLSALELAKRIFSAIMKWKDLIESSDMNYIRNQRKITGMLEAIGRKIEKIKEGHRYKVFRTGTVEDLTKQFPDEYIVFGY